MVKPWLHWKEQDFHYWYGCKSDLIKHGREEKFDFFSFYKCWALKDGRTTLQQDLPRACKPQQKSPCLHLCQMCSEGRQEWKHLKAWWASGGCSAAAAGPEVEATWWEIWHGKKNLKHHHPAPLPHVSHQVPCLKSSWATFLTQEPPSCFAAHSSTGALLLSFPRNMIGILWGVSVLFGFDRKIKIKILEP